MNLTDWCLSKFIYHKYYSAHKAAWSTEGRIIPQIKGDPLPVRCHHILSLEVDRRQESLSSARNYGWKIVKNKNFDDDIVAPILVPLYTTNKTYDG